MTPHRLIFVRHGEYSGNLSDQLPLESDRLPLNANGVTQARRLRDWLASSPFATQIDEFVCSPSVRTVETANILVDRPWTKHRQLTKRNRGFLEYLSKAEAAAKYPQAIERKLNNPFSAVPPGGESLAHVAQRRVLPCVTSLSGNTALIVTHSGPMWAIRHALIGLHGSTMLDARASDSHPLDIKNCQMDIYESADSNDVAYVAFRSLHVGFNSITDTGWLDIPTPMKLSTEPSLTLA
jgi:2,3-bisphosphoglycerate-dependent phosphoglycerate mutase